MTTQKKMGEETIFINSEGPAKRLHDLYQPLNSIKMTSGGIMHLLKQGKRISDEELAECMQEISCQTDRLTQLIKGFKL